MKRVQGLRAGQRFPTATPDSGARQRREADLFLADLFSADAVPVDGAGTHAESAEDDRFMADWLGDTRPRRRRAGVAEDVSTDATAIPLDVLSDENGAPVVVRQSATSAGARRLQGTFRIGGGDGLLFMGTLEVGATFPQAFALSGTIRLFGDDNLVSMRAVRAGDRWSITSTGTVSIGNGLSLSPSADAPVLSLSADPVNGAYAFSASGALAFPRAEGEGPSEVKLSGALRLHMQNRRPHIDLFSMGVALKQWPLSPDVVIEDVSVRLAWARDRVAFALAASIPLGGGFVLDVIDTLPSDSRDTVDAGLDPRRGLTITRRDAHLDFAFVGGARLRIPPQIISNADGDAPIVVEATGAFTFSTDRSRLPALSDLSVALRAPRIHLGGANGLLVENAELRGTDLDRLLSLGTARHPTLTLSGKLTCPFTAPGGSVALSLRGARFRFERRGQAPQFTFADGGELGFESQSNLAGLPIEVTKAIVRFEKGGALPDVLAPKNLKITLGGRLNLAFGGAGKNAKGAGEAFGAIDELTARLGEDGLPRFTLDGASVGVTDLDFGVTKLTGALGFHNLTDPTNIQLEGVLGGAVSGAGVKALVAIKFEKGIPTPLGVCLDVSAGPSGIPLLYGFVITGASGGISFANASGSPCDFRTYANAKKPLATGKALSTARPVRSTACPDDCPPQSMNILCQPHPDQDMHPGRVILKFTALEESFWAKLPLPGGTTLGDRLKQIDAELNRRVGPLPDPKSEAKRIVDLVGQGTERAIEGIVPAGNATEPMLRALTTTLTTTLEGALSALSSAQDKPPSVYAIVKNELYRGVNCPDATLQVSGTFSYIGASAFISVTGGVTVSTTGTIGVTGFLNLLGMPIGQLRGFVTATSSTGDPEPSMCGDLRVELGPLHVGLVSFVYRCPGCVTNVADVVRKRAMSLGLPLLSRLLTRIGGEAPRFSDGAGLDPNWVQGALARLSPNQANQLLAQVLSDVQMLSPADARRATAFVGEIARELWDGFRPEITLCGKIAPKLFGFPIGGELVDGFGVIRKDRIEFAVGFSPMYLLGRVLPIADLFSGMDAARLGVAVTLPTIEDLLLDGLTGQFASQAQFEAYLAKGLERFLRDAVLTFSYQFFPLGMKVADGQGRVVMPYLTPHPKSRRSTWRNPDVSINVGATDRIPSRREVLFGALKRGQLSNINWTGAVKDVVDVPASRAGNRPANRPDLQLQRDYFPHGGIVGAGKLQIPRLLWDAPPLPLLARIASGADVIQKIPAVIELIRDWVLATREAGSLGFYIPAPNPPVAQVEDATRDVRATLDAILSFDTEQLAKGREAIRDLYSLELAFFEGDITGRLLGLEFGTAEVRFVPPTTPGGQSELRARTSVSADPRIRSWIREATLELVITNPSADQALPISERKPVEHHFQALLKRIEQLASGNAAQSKREIEATLAEIQQALVARLPKASASAKVRLRIPEGVSSLIQADSELDMHVYSPLYDSRAHGQGALAMVQRNGGICLAGQVTFTLVAAWQFRTHAEFAVLLSDGAALAAPAQPARLVGQVRVDGAGKPPRLLNQDLPFKDAVLTFDSAPPPGQPMLALRGNLPSLRFGPLRLESPLAGAPLAATLKATPISGTPPGLFRVSLGISALDVRSPCLASGTPIHVRPEGDQREIELGGAGDDIVVEAPAGITLVVPNSNAVVLKVSSPQPLLGRAKVNGATLSVSLALPAGVRVDLLPGAAPFAPTFTLDAAVDLTLKSDGSFHLLTRIPPIGFEGGHLTIHGDGPGESFAVEISSGGVRLQGAAFIRMRLPGLPPGQVKIDTFRVQADGKFAIEANGGALRLQREGNGFRLAGLPPNGLPDLPASLRGSLRGSVPAGMSAPASLVATPRLPSLPFRRR